MKARHIRFGRARKRRSFEIMFFTHERLLLENSRDTRSKNSLSVTNFGKNFGVFSVERIHLRIHIW